MDPAESPPLAPNARQVVKSLKNWARKNFTRTPSGSSSTPALSTSPLNELPLSNKPFHDARSRRLSEAPIPRARHQTLPRKLPSRLNLPLPAINPCPSLRLKIPKKLYTDKRLFAPGGVNIDPITTTEFDSALEASKVDEPRIPTRSLPSLRLEIPDRIYIDRRLFAPIDIDITPIRYRPSTSTTSFGGLTRLNNVGISSSLLAPGIPPFAPAASKTRDNPQAFRELTANKRSGVPPPKRVVRPLPAPTQIPGPSVDIPQVSYRTSQTKLHQIPQPGTDAIPPSQFGVTPFTSASFSSSQPIPHPDVTTQRDVKDNDEHVVSISRSMTTQQIVSHLITHGCNDLSNAVQLSTFGEHPVSHGGFSDIYRGNLLDGTLVAVKSLRISLESLSQNPKHLKHAARELHTWGKCRHPNVIPLLGLALFRGRTGMVSPWMGQGSLPHYLKRTPGANRHSLCVQICEGLEYLHQIGIVHADLKGANVLISDEGIPALTDFGNSLLMDRTMKFTETTSSASMTVRWSAAELIAGTSPPTKASDVYALGMTIFETISGMIPYYRKQDVTIMLLVTVKKEPPERPECIPRGRKNGDQLWELLLRCWRYEPEERPSANEVTANLKTIVGEDFCHV